MLMTIVLLLAFAFGAQGLNVHPIWTDELYSVTNMGGFEPPYSPTEIIKSVADNFPDHVPLFFLLGAGWAQLAGWSQFALRLFSVLAGMLTIAWLYRFGTDVFNRRTGLVAAILMGTSAYMILYFHNFRMYPLLLMFAAMHTWLYWRLAHGHRVTRLTWCLFVATAVALVYTHMFSIIWFTGLGIYHLIFVAKSGRWLRIMLGWGIGALLFLPYLPVLISGVQIASEKAKVTSVAASPAELIPTFFYLLANGTEMLFILFVGILALAFWRKRDPAAIKFMLIPLAMMSLIVLLNEMIGLIPINRMRYFLILWIPFMLLFAYGLSRMPSWTWITALCLLLWCVAGYRFYRSDDILGYVGGMAHPRGYPPLQDYVYHLQGKVRSEDYVLGFSRLDYVNEVLRLGKSAADFYTELHLGIDGAFVRQGAFGDWLARDIRAKIDRQPYLLLTYDPQNTPLGKFEKVLSAIQVDHVACHVIIDLPNLRVQRYVSSIIGCEREEYEPIAYENGIMIVDKFAEYDKNADIVRILTGWEVPDEQMLYEYNVSMQILTAEGQNTGRQVDRHLYDDLLKWNVIELPTNGLPSGDYRVVVIVYDRETGKKKVNGVDLATSEVGKILPVSTIFTIKPLE